ncbi:MAG: putative alpha-1,2-mannosidase [Polaribacter sp.]|jgi:predicted alpha-1,2-mannosidase
MRNYLVKMNITLLKNYVNILILVLMACSSFNKVHSQENIQPAELVYPLLDSANSRWFFFASASRPFGMVNLSPDMGIGGAWDSGYRYNRDTINFFSHIHAWQLSGIPVLPVTGNFKGHLGAKKYGSRFSHENEVVKAGYHSVDLETYGVKVELTSTTRVGFHRYTFPNGKEKYVLLDLGTVLGPSATEKGYALQRGKNEIVGYALMAATRRRPKATYVYYAIKFDKSFERMQAWQDGKLMGKIKKFQGSGGGIYVNFKGNEAQTVQMKVAISYVSEEQARLNMKNELNHWDFERVVRESFDDWNNWLGRIKIEGGTKKEQSRFYTDLWHALQGRRVISDFNGKYSDMTGDKPRIGQIPMDENGIPKFKHYNSDAFWGAQWTINTLWHLVYPEVSEEFINSMLLMYQDGGLIPRGPAGGNYTYVMTGASSTPFIVSAYMKGIRGFDVHKAYEGMRKNAMPGGMMGKAGYEHYTEFGGGLKYYIHKGYVPYPNPDKNDGYHNEGAGQTLEYAYQDWCLSQMAKKMGRDDDAILFSGRAKNYRNLWDKSSGWMRPKSIDGRWNEPFNPILSHHGFVESTAAQSTWFVPHDLAGLFNLMGGSDRAAEKLNGQFLIANSHDFISKPFKSDRFVHNALRNTYLNYGNQPSMQVGFIFNYVGKPWLTQYWTREVVERIYSHLDPENGYNGDEDQGFMGSLAVLLKLGLFEMRGGAAIKPIYEIGSPIFDKVTIKLNKEYYSGKEFVIETRNNSSKNRYVQSSTLNGETLNNAWFYHDELIKGGKLILNMSDTPNKNWGISQLPPSMSTDSN